MPSEDTVELRWVFSVIRRWAWLIIACSLVVGAIAYAVTSRQPPVYRAGTTLLVLPPDDAKTTEVNVLAAGERLALTYSQMIMERPTLEDVVAHFGSQVSAQQLARQVAVEPIKDTQLIRITTSATSPAKAAELANTVAQVFIARAKRLEEARYQEDLDGMQGRSSALQALIAETETKADAVSRQLIQDQTERTRLESLLPGYRDDYRFLQARASDLHLAAAHIASNLQIANDAQVSALDQNRAYAATVLLRIELGPATEQDMYSTVMANERLAATYVQMITTRRIMEAAVAELHTAQSPDALSQQVTAEVVPGTSLIRLKVTAGNADEAGRLANAIARLFVAQLQESQLNVYSGPLADTKAQLAQLDEQMTQTQSKIADLAGATLREQRELNQMDDLLARYRSDYRTLQNDYEQQKSKVARTAQTISVSEPASIPRSPIDSAALYLLLGLAAGAGLGLVIAFVLERLGDALKTPDDIAGKLGLVPLGTIARLNNAERSAHIASESPSFGAFRMLAANIVLSPSGGRLRTILVTSPSPREGKSLVAANLAAALAMTGRQVALVDGDFRSPSLHELFGLQPENGLTDAVRQGRLNGNLRPTWIPDLFVLPAGEILADPARLINSPGLAQLLDNLAEQVDLVIIDGPPVLSVADTPFLAAGVDGVVLVFRAGHTSSRAATEAVALLKRTGSHWIGAVLNDAMPHHRPYNHALRRGWQAIWTKDVPAPTVKEPTSQAADPARRAEPESA